jgi:hypothetical protein
MWKHPYHRSNQECEGWNLLLPQTAVLSCYAIAIGPKDFVGLSVHKVHISATRLRIYIKTAVDRWKWRATTSGLKKLY